MLQIVHNIWQLDETQTNSYEGETLYLRNMWENICTKEQPHNAFTKEIRNRTDVGVKRSRVNILASSAFPLPGGGVENAMTQEKCCILLQPGHLLTRTQRRDETVLVVLRVLVSLRENGAEDGGLGYS